MTRPMSCLIHLAALAGLCAPAGAVADWIHAGWEHSYGSYTSLEYHERQSCSSAQPRAFAANIGVPDGFSRLHRLEATIDLCTAPNVLPPFWTGEGGCTPVAAQPGLPLDPPPEGAWPYWHESATVELRYIPIFEGSLLNLRMVVTVEQPAELASPLPASGAIAAFRLVLDHLPATCSGCDVPGCMMLNGVTVWGDGGERRFYGPYGSAFGQWSGGIGDCPFIVPLAQQSFGTLKAAARR